jgi:NitT/TauT family transport system ATP-binding protein
MDDLTRIAPDLTEIAAPSPLLVVDDVSIGYRTPTGWLTAVDRVSFNISAGERLVLLGPSGCGKSTLLRAVGGFLKPSAGAISFRSALVTKPGPDRMTVFQEFDQLLPWRTVLGNVRFALERGRGMGRREATEVARDWLNRVGLTRAVDSYPHTLSGGMKQRVAIARAFALQPALLLMDEPFAALDALTRRQMQDELLALCEETGSTALFVTHGIDEAIRVGTRILAMTPHPGRLAASFDVPIDTRERGTARFAALEGHIQNSVFAEREAEHA